MKTILKTLLFLLTLVLLSQCEKDDPQVNIPDDNFLNALIELGADTNGDGIISPAEAEVITYLDVSGTYETRGEIENLTGIEAFVNIDTLKCDRNHLTTLDVSENTLLAFLTCGWNQLTSLDVSGNTALRNLYCQSNQLSNLDLSNNTVLRVLRCGEGNLLSSLDVSNNTALEHLLCGNQLTSLDVSNNTLLIYLDCRGNQLTSLDVSNNTALKYLICYSNQLSNLDVSTNTRLTWLWCGGNLLSSLDISNNSSISTLDIKEMPSLYEVCVWEMPFPPNNGVHVDTTGSPNVYFTTDCN